jgi:hydroxyacylglutathione hydrolase
MLRLGDGNQTMLLRTFFDPKLAHASYLVACQTTGAAMVIDPSRTVNQYLAAAAAEDVTIIAAAETHIHADFVSGARELAEQIGATLYLSGAGGAQWQYRYVARYPHRLLQDGDHWQIGNLALQALHTPGHTPEHMAYLVTDRATAAVPMGMFTGDFVFVGDVGRPDLLETAVGVKGAKTGAARELFNSLKRFKQMPDYLQVWPAHRAGTLCGKALGAMPSSTVGYERQTNWAFQVGDEAAFVAQVLDGQPEPPRYFATMKRVNRDGPARRRLAPVPPCLDVENLIDWQRAGATLMDTRSVADFAAGHISGAINNPLAGRTFTTYAGWFLAEDQPYSLVIDPGDLESAIDDLARIGLDQVAGYFPIETIQQWSQRTSQPLGMIEQVTVVDVAAAIRSGELVVIDVRSAAEFAQGHLPQARNIVLGHVLERLHEIPADRPVVLQCKSGFRSSIAAALLASRGRTNVVNLQGGYQAWLAAQLPVESGVRPLSSEGAFHGYQQ